MYHLVFQAGDGNADTQGPINLLYRAREMLYSPNYFGPGNRPSLQENWEESLYVSFPTNSWNRFNTGVMFTKTRWTNTNQDEYFGLVLGDDTDNSDAGGVNQQDRYWLNILSDPLPNGDYPDVLRISNAADDNHAGEYDINVGTNPDTTFPGNTYVTGKPNPPTVYSEMANVGVRQEII